MILYININLRRLEMRNFIFIRIEKDSKRIYRELVRVDLLYYVGSFFRMSLSRIVDKSCRLVVL